MILAEKPQTSEFANAHFHSADRTCTDNLIVLGHHQKYPIILEIILLNIVQVVKLMTRLVIGNRLFQCALVVENGMSDTIDNLFSNRPLVWRESDTADF